MRKIALVFLMLVAAGCSESYGPSGSGNRILLGGGYDDKRIDANRWEVRYGSADYNYSSDMALYRSAEIAKKEGFPFFTAVETNKTLVPIYSNNRYVGSSVFVTLQMQGVRAYRDRCVSGKMNRSTVACDLYETDGILASPPK